MPSHAGEIVNFSYSGAIASLIRGSALTSFTLTSQPFSVPHHFGWGDR
jgi:hypothetical protein